MQWLVLCTFSIILCALSEIIERNVVKEKDNDVTLKVFVWLSIWSLLMIILMYALDLSESNMPPWEIIISMPEVILSAVCSALYCALLVSALRFVGVTIYECIDSANAMLIFIGMVIINIFSGRLAEINSIMYPKYLIPILMIIIGNIVLTIVSSKKDEKDLNKTSNKKNKRSYLIIGIILSLASVLFDVSDSLISSLVLSEEEANSFDYVIGYMFMTVIFGIATYLYLWKSDKKPYNPFKKGERIKSLSEGLGILSGIVYLLAVSLDVVKTQIAWAVYPVIPMLLAAILLKEKYSKKQYACIAVVLIGSIAFGIVDILKL